jgi:hypothetical protein
MIGSVADIEQAPLQRSVHGVWCAMYWHIQRFHMMVIAAMNQKRAGLSAQARPCSMVLWVVRH